jgi:creatinine amidohydrolase
MNRLESTGQIYQAMTWEEIEREANRGAPVVIPIGATEQHGLHLPVCTDWVLPAQILRLASAARPFIVGPELVFGYRSRPGSGGGQHFPGTLSLRATTFMAVIEDVLLELIRTGFKKLVLYNWHYENSGFVYEPAFLVSGMHPEVKIVVIEDAMPTLSVEEQGVLWPLGYPGLALEHAALIETSLWMYNQPEAVRTERMQPDAPERVVRYDVLPIDRSLSTASGSLASPVEASAEKGELLTRRLVERVVTILDAEFPDLGEQP